MNRAERVLRPLPEMDAIDRVHELLDQGLPIPANLLFDLAHDEIPMLVDSIFPKAGIVGFFGSSDTGKSAFLRQLAIAVASASKYFLGFKIRATHNRVLYVTTEDDHISTSALLRKQSGHKRELVENIKFLFDSNNLIDNLKAELAVNPVDCIIVDTYSDVIRADMNQGYAVRSFLNGFRELATNFECLIIFLHHSGKGKQHQVPSKDNILGSQGFEGKTRVLIEFKSDPKIADLRHLCIVKGNYVKGEEKTKSIVLRFDENMIFHNTGKRTPFHELASAEPRGLLHDPKVIEQVAQWSKEGYSLRQMEEKCAESNIDLKKSSIHRIVKEKVVPEKDTPKKVAPESSKPENTKVHDFDSYLDRYMNI